MIATHIIDITGGTVHTVDSLLAAAVMSGSDIVAAVNTQLGSTVWQSGSVAPEWGDITGTLSDQTDLQTALDAKAASVHTHVLEDLSDIDVTADMVAFDQGIRPGLYDDLDSPPVGTIFESINDGHLYWVHRDGSVHLLCADGGGYGGGSTAWGDITGTLSDQTDLQAELDDKQPLDEELTAIAGLTSASDKLPYFTGPGTAALATLTAQARSLLDDADASAMQTTLGLEIGTDVQAFDQSLAAFAALSKQPNQGIYFTDIDGSIASFNLTAAARGLLDDADTDAMLETLGAASQATADALQKQIQPAIRNDRYYTSYAGNIQSTRTMTAGRMFYMPLVIPNSITATRIGVNVTTALAGSARLGIYADSSGVPSGAPLLDAGTVDTSTTGEKEITISLALSPGLYWIVVVASSASTLTAENLNANSANFPNLGVTSGSGSGITLAFEDITFGSLPSVGTLTWNTSKIPPRVWIRTP